MDFDLADMFGSSPQTIMTDQCLNRKYADLDYHVHRYRRR